MTRFEALNLVPLMAAVLVAAAQDMRSRRIGNALTLALLLAGIVSAVAGTGAIGAQDALLGAAVGFGLMFVPFAIEAVGGGDVKLMAAVGAWVGPWMVAEVFAGQAIIGMLIVLVQAAAAGKIAELFRNSAVIAANVGAIRDVGVDHVIETGKRNRCIERPLPFAVPVITAIVLVVGWGHFHA